MTKEDRYYTNMLYNALKSILSHSDAKAYNLSGDDIEMAKNAICAFERYDLIKQYKQMERQCYQEGNYDKYKALKSARLELEKGESANGEF